MRYWLGFILFSIAAALPAQDGIPRWDALPAVDVLHLQGPYAGRNVCPMCQHGYDAGLLVFLPAATAPADAARMASSLQAASEKIDDPRFRPFLVLTGASPSKELLAAVHSAASNWHVAHLSSAALTDASADFKRSLDGRAHGYVFAQRRVLWAFEPDALDATWFGALIDYASYAMTFLHSTYALPVGGHHPDAPKGRLWAAPSELSNRIALSESQHVPATPVCFSDHAGSRLRDALVALTLANPTSNQRSVWGRTDDAGCVSLQGSQDAHRIDVELFGVLQPMASARLDMTQRQRGRDLEVRMPSAEATAVTGKERIVGLPCEGCELVFEELPSTLSPSTRLAPQSEPGEALLLSGVVRDGAGLPRPNAIVYAYQTDHAGRYPTATSRSGTDIRHGRLRAWARTGAAGRYTFHTIRPGAYPGSDTPQHIHMHLIEPGRCTYYLGDVLFADDPLLTSAVRAKQASARGGNGIVEPQGSGRAGWTATRDITLGLNISDYGSCSS